MSDHKQIVDDRGQYYGHPLENHTCTADLWSTYLQRKYGVFLTMDYRDVCWMNILQKISRDANAPKADNVDDTMGYAENIRMAEAKENESGHDDLAEITKRIEVSHGSDHPLVGLVRRYYESGGGGVSGAESQPPTE